MYKIKNTTKGKLILTDIGVKLNASETVDLDALLPREKIESSTHLKVAEANELIAILHKDVVAVLTAAPTTASIDPVMLMEMEARIRAHIVEQMNHQNSPEEVKPKVVEPTPQQDLSGISSKLEQLLAAIQKNPQNSQPTSHEVEEHVMDADKLVEVHAKALQRLTKSAEGHVEATSTTHSSDISDRADELGDFLK